MATEVDPVELIGSKASKVRHHDITLRGHLNSLSNRLVAACNLVQLRCCGKERHLQDAGPPGEYIYGCWFFDADGLRVHHGYTEDDISEALQPDSYGTAPAVKTIDDCPIAWLKKLAEEEFITDILERIGERIGELEEEAESSARSAEGLCATPRIAISSAFEKAAESLGYERVLKEWREAQEAIYSNPENAITRANSLFESICKHILEALGQPLPSDQSIKPLFKATSKALDLDPTDQAEDALRGLCGGLGTVTQQIGLLRTKSGDAHGKSAGHVSLTPMHARFAVNAAGSAGTFLMECWQVQKAGNRTRCTSSNQ